MISSNCCRDDGFLDALPTRVDPSIDGGPVALPAAAAIMHGRRWASYESLPSNVPLHPWTKGSKSSLPGKQHFALVENLQYKIINKIK